MSAGWCDGWRQHNTYDVEFYGEPCEQLVILRRCVRCSMMPTRWAMSNWRMIVENWGQGSRWIDSDLFNGDTTSSRFAAFRRIRSRSGLQEGMGARDAMHPQFQIAMAASSISSWPVHGYGRGLGDLSTPRNIRRLSTRSIIQLQAKAWCITPACTGLCLE